MSERKISGDKDEENMKNNYNRNCIINKLQ